MSDTQRILACVTVQRACEKMILAGAKLAKEVDGQLCVLHVAREGQDLLGYPVEGEAMEYLYRICTEHNAEMTVLRAKDVVDAIAKFAIKKEISVILIGAAKKDSDRNIAQSLTSKLPGMIFRPIYADEA